MIRAGVVKDIPRVIELMKEMCQRSRYKDRVKVHPVLAEALCEAAADPENIPMMLFVAVRKEIIEAFLIGHVIPVFGIGDQLTALDPFFYMSEKAYKRDAFRLAASYTRWAQKIPGVVEAKLSAVSAIGPAEENIKLYERLGYIVDGYQCRKEIF